MLTSRALNNDPHPYVGKSGRRYSEKERVWAALKDAPLKTYYRKAYNNRPNRILAQIRRAESSANDIFWMVSAWSVITEYGFEFKPTPLEQKHAKKVLMKYVKVYGVWTN